MDYTKAQREAIARAYGRILRIVESDHKAERWIREAYKIERRERGSQTLTQEMLIESFLCGWEKNISLGGVLYLSEGCGMVATVGAAIREYMDANGLNARRYVVMTDDLVVMREAMRAGKDAREARCAKIMGARSC